MLRVVGLLLLHHLRGGELAARPRAAGPRSVRLALCPCLALQAGSCRWKPEELLPLASRVEASLASSSWRAWAVPPWCLVACAGWHLSSAVGSWQGDLVTSPPPVRFVCVIRLGGCPRGGAVSAPGTLSLPGLLGQSLPRPSAPGTGRTEAGGKDAAWWAPPDAPQASGLPAAGGREATAV